jgi:UDP-N-acetylmuramoyl-tripeptide--D-alanyl-D-alanine ligase
MIWGLAAVCLVAAIFASLRWLRIAQREHYLPVVSKFALRWWISRPLNAALFFVAAVGVTASLFLPWLAFLVPLAQVGPIGLSLRGRTSPLAWTPRLRRLAFLIAIYLLILLAIAVLNDDAWLAAFAVFALPWGVDGALIVLAGLEKNLGQKWVTQAADRLASSGARVVAITGSYGKTSTKMYTAHLLAGAYRVVASPASFNNRMGLARAINEQLAAGTEVFVAEMGTYGRGEIAEMCSWTHPEVSAIVSIGPVHLERFRSEENIVAAKSEILEGAKAGVIAIDHPLLAALARAKEGSIDLVSVSTEGGARVVVGGGRIVVDGRPLAPLPEDALEVNLGVAIGICLALGVDPEQVVGRLEGLPRPEHRQTVSRSERGFTVIDDTYNSNPAGARLGLERLVAHGAEGRKVLVTPGMVELGPRQSHENEEFAAAAAALVDNIVIVGSTNRAALLRGSANGAASVTVVASRDEAVSWVREHLGPGDAVLYENDLPDHYP